MEDGPIQNILIFQLHHSFCLGFSPAFTNGLEDSVIVGNNNAQLKTLTNWLKPVVRSGYRWNLCWRASRDGWAATKFHTNCDGKGASVTIVKVGNYIFGGYTSTSWSK